MKLSNRDKKILLIFVILVGGYLLYTFGVQAYTNYKNDLQAEYDSEKLIYDELTLAIQMKPVYERDLAITKENIMNMSNGYLDKIEQEKIIAYVREIMNEHEVGITSMTFAPIEVEASEANGSATIYKSTYIVGYKAEYDNIIEMLKELQEREINAVLSNNSIIVGDEKILNGNLTVTMYSVDNEYTQANAIEWEDLFESGKDDPFFYDGIVIDNGAISRKYDFLLTAKPTSSDYPSVIIQAANDETGETNVNIDSNKVETLRVFLRKEGEVYQYRYQTANSSFPANNKWQDFVPANSGKEEDKDKEDNKPVQDAKPYINMRVLSTERNGDNDKSGLRLIIDNKTGLEVNVYILNDDPTRPRVTVDKTTGVRAHKE